MGNPAYTINVADYGAVGDGVTDDLAAINRALAACPGGGTVVFPARTIKAVGAITIPKDNIRLVGHGATLIGASQADYVRFALNGRTNVQFYGFTFDASYVDAAGAVNQGLIDLIDCSTITIANCIFQNTSNCGVRMLGACSDVEIYGCRFETYYTAIFGNQDGAAQPVNCRLRGNHFGTPIAGTSGAITIHGLSGAPYGGHTISDNIIEGSVVMGIELQTRVDACTVTGNVIRGAGTGVSLSGSNRMVVSANIINGTTVYGIEVAGCTGAIITGNTVDGRSTAGAIGTGTGIGVTSLCNSVTVSNNYVIGFTSEHIDVQESIGVRLIGNQVVMTTGVSDTAGYCVTAKSYSQLAIDSNTFSIVSGSAFIFLNSTDQPCDGLSVTSNIFSGRANVAGISFYSPNNGHRDMLFQNNNTANADSAIGFISLSNGYISGARAMNNLGHGDQNFNSNINVPAVSTSSNTALDFRYETLLMDASSAPRTGFLPTAVSNAGLAFTMVKTDSSANLVHLVPSGSQTINGASSWTLSGLNHAVTVQSDASNWRITSKIVN